ncbi:AraC family transcriptional regulator [Pseudobacter ginsenosidimutans]|uniref:AraC family transcriptional regulator n=1 Tax=Pseudobacter ginsenosidimutans TaxID=661488 RepID=A0A4Q7N453_9BACT|nr:helix-turn-helix domain-containing protein [Pseudobacter ginsenosidimutans]QEC44300.1 helix-turn-helix domain-containing protein [Pseudobacter ginsenosidimutans]RZS75760.1 AraC family transcriptional regulator [Pseudobacter ginsenosidimutans]
MKQYRQFEPVLVSDFEVKEWHHPVHTHNHYEIIYISKGKGIHHVNQSSLAYGAGNVFFIGPDDEHYFDIHQTTRFVYVKFTDEYMHQLDTHYFSGIRQLEYLIKRRDVHFSGFRFSSSDQQTVNHLFRVIMSLKDDPAGNEHLIWMQLISIASILQRNLPEMMDTAGQPKNMQALFCYIHKFIYSPAKLRATVLARQFNSTEDYIGRYFRKHAGITLRDYVQEYRNTLIRKRLDNGEYSLKQIAAEFGLTDESHVSKLLKRPEPKRRKRSVGK